MEQQSSMSRKILIVDDSATIRKLISQPLQQEGFVTVEAINGEEGIKKIHSDELDCVICDHNLPNKNGIEVVEEIKGDPRFDRLPIVMLSNEMTEELLAKAKVAGASGWILKPCDIPLIVSTVKKLMHCPC